MTDTAEMTEPEIDAVLAGADPDAPFGRFKNGKPRKSPLTAAVSVPPPGRSKAPKTPRPRAGLPDYAQLTRNVLQLPVVGLTVLGQGLYATGRQNLGAGLQVDAMTVGLYTEQAAAIGARMAESDPRAARWLEKYGKGGVLGEAISFGLMIGGQFLVNHGRLAPMPAAGLLPPDEIVRRARAAAGMEPEEQEPADAVPDR